VNYHEKETHLGQDGVKPSEVELENTEVLADGHFRFEQLTLRIGTFAGKLSKPMKREVLRSGRAVVVLLYDPVTQQFILIEQFRIGAYLNKLPSAWILECVAGMVDEGETNEAAARREVREETGCHVGRMEFVGVFLSSPGISDELITIYVGEIDAVGVGGIHGQEAEGEDIRVVVFAVDDALAAAEAGAVVNIMSQVALLWFAGHGEALRQKWLSSASGPASERSPAAGA
jgi:ADP-ribose pyrophosphatase